MPVYDGPARLMLEGVGVVVGGVLVPAGCEKRGERRGEERSGDDRQGEEKARRNSGSGLQGEGGRNAEGVAARGRHRRD